MHVGSSNIMFACMVELKRQNEGSVGIAVRVKETSSS